MGVSLASSGKQLPESFYSYSDLNDEKHVEVNAFFVFVAHYLYLVYDNTSPFRGRGGGGTSVWKRRPFAKKQKTNKVRPIWTARLWPSLTPKRDFPKHTNNYQGHLISTAWKKSKLTAPFGTDSMREFNFFLLSDPAGLYNIDQSQKLKLNAQ